ncbi:MAG: LysR family transcriptional regulator [Lautropia sp.]|nr:LysR family transcriptional regulator [Lautropia sp.]
MVLVNNERFQRGQGAASLNRLLYFCAVVEAGSFTLAAERLGVGKAVVSQQVAQLEKTLRTTLLLRTTRRLSLTEEGGRFYHRCVDVLKAAELAFDELSASNETPTGTLRLTAPLDVGLQVLVPVIATFRARYPACRVEADFSDSKRDLLSGEYELSIRAGWLTEQHLSARRLGAFEQVLVAPGSWADSGEADRIRSPEALADLPFVANRALRDPLAWRFRHPDGEALPVRLVADLAFDTTLAVKEAVLAGAGLAVLPDYVVRAELASGRLCRLLPQWQLPKGDIHAVFPSSRYRQPRVRAFIDLLVARMNA